MSFWEDKKVVVTGGNGFLGSHLVGLLNDKGCKPFIPSSRTFDLRCQDDVDRMFKEAGKIDMLFNLAANCGGIGYNQRHPYTLFFDNIQIGTNVINLAIEYGVKKLVQVGTVCAYPKYAPVPFSEESLWDGYPEHTNAPYGLAKKLLLVQLQAAREEFDFNGIYLLPTNLYGPGDNFDPQRSHVIPALIRKFTEAKQRDLPAVEVWGTGCASRDFLYVRDAAWGLMLAAEKYERPEPLNLGSGREVRISWLAYQIQKLTDYEGSINWDTSKPDGQPRRGLNSSRASRAIGWIAQTDIIDGLKETIKWYQEELQFA